MKFEDVNAIARDLLYVDDSDIYFYDACKAYYLEQWRERRDARFALAYISMHNRRYKRLRPEITPFLESVALESQHPDAITYYGLALYRNNEKKDALKKITTLREQINTPNGRSICDLFIACSLWRLGNYEGYVAGLDKFFDEKDPNFKPYLSIPASTAWRGSEPPTLVSNTLLDGMVTIVPERNVDYIISVSCDLAYFHKYGKFFVESLAGLPDNYYCHIALVDAVEPAETSMVLPDNIVVTTHGIESSDNCGPISSAIRFVHAWRLRERCTCPIIVMDFDVVFKRSLMGLVSECSNSDMGLRVLEDVLPWQVITAGFSVFLDNEVSRKFLEYINNFYLNTLEREGLQWWIDQNAMECADRFINKNARKVNLRHLLNEYILIPTGSEASKLAQMERALSATS